jgi:hypothetical protein
MRPCEVFAEDRSTVETADRQSLTQQVGSENS